MGVAIGRWCGAAPSANQPASMEQPAAMAAIALSNAEPTRREQPRAVVRDIKAQQVVLKAIRQRKGTQNQWKITAYSAASASGTQSQSHSTGVKPRFRTTFWHDVLRV